VAAIQAYQASYLIVVLGFPPADVAGAVFLSTLVLTVAALVFAPIAGKLSDRVGRRRPFVIGAGGDLRGRAGARSPAAARSHPR